MRIDRCMGCGEHVNINSDHAEDCPKRQPSAWRQAAGEAEVHEWTQWIHKSLVLNQNSLPHWGTGSKIKKDLKVLGKVAGKGLRKKFRKVRMEVTVSYPVAWNADAANYYPTMKAYVDGMVDKPPTVKGQKQGPARGCLVDDSDAYFDGPHLTGSGERSGRKDFFRFDCRLEVLE